MKSIQKKASLKEDEKFLEGINLVTGVKIDYGKHLLTDSQISAMCINETLSPIDKLCFILTQGQKIQKWSIFQNLAYYIQSADNAEHMLLLLEKNYVEYEEFLMIIGEGLLSYLNKSKTQRDIITKKSADLVYRLAHRTVTAAKLQGSEILSDWMALLTSLFQLPDAVLESRSIKLAELRQYINGSFSMNTLPQRRKTALQLINALLYVIELSQQVEKQAHNKILFFNSDTNPSTRLVICHIVEKILRRNCENNDLWKCLQDYYYNDKSYNVKEKAFQIMVSLRYTQNSEIVFQQLENQDASFIHIVHRHTTMIFKTFSEELKKHQSLQFKVISFLNRLLRNNSQLGLKKLIDGYAFLSQSINQTVLSQQLQLKKFDLENMNVIDYLLLLHNLIGHLQFRDQIKRNIFKGIRFHDFDLKISKQAQQNLLEMLDLHQQEDISTFSLTFSKLIQNSKWNYIELFLQKIPQIKFFQSQYEKIIGCVIKIYQNCPYFLLQRMNAVILWLMLADRKNLEIYLKVRDKFQVSRCWMHRRNYIKLYAYLKKNASYQFNRNIAPLLYKSILAEKNSLIKQEFLRDFTVIYSYLDPTNQQEKNSIKETFFKMVEDKDKEVSSLAIVALQTVKETERDYELVARLLTRNKTIFQRELEVEQVQSQTKKHIKTQKLISGKDPRQVKPKKISNLDTTKTSLNLMKLSTQRNKPLIVIQAKPALKRSTSNQPKQNVLKFNLPSFKKGRI